ncbi:hypothetical protein BN871_BC_00150 [Paenibacillus sp. P22]|nr:hypothetical protein BN871_BC_00150 [Paenibacillus sp. P22]
MQGVAHPGEVPFHQRLAEAVNLAQLCLPLRRQLDVPADEVARRQGIQREDQEGGCQQDQNHIAQAADQICAHIGSLTGHPLPRSARQGMDSFIAAKRLLDVLERPLRQARRQAVERAHSQILDPGVVRVHALLVACEDDRKLVVQQLVDFLVDRFALLDVGRLQTFFVQLGEFRVAVAFDLSIHELHQAVRRIRKHRSREGDEIVIPAFHLGDERVEVGKDFRLEFHAQRLIVLFGYGDEDIRVLALGAEIVDRQLLAVLLADAASAFFPAGFVQQRLRFVQVVLVRVDAFFRVRPRDRGRRNVGDAARSLRRIHVDALTVEAVGQRLAHLFVLERFMLQVHLQVTVCARRIRNDIHESERLQLVDVFLGGAEGGVVDLSGLQVLPSVAFGCFVDEIRRFRLVAIIVLVGCEAHFLPRRELDQLIRPGADRSGAQRLHVSRVALFVVLAVVRLGQHIAAERRQRGCIGLLQRHADRLRIRDLDAFDGSGLAFFISVGAFDAESVHLRVAVIGLVVQNRPGEGDILGRKRRAVAELQSLAQMERVRPSILGGFPFLGQTRDRLRLVVHENERGVQKGGYVAVITALLEVRRKGAARIRQADDDRVGALLGCRRKLG